ncbi:MAG: non-homologous end-joining DNA ligase [Oscillospiraceae bacterium]|nr:non-homologous end-joining DNA ligase [Oscillospiraceae bacterium]
MSLLEQGPMLIGAEGEPFDSSDYLFELKLDGERCLALLDREKTVLRNKRGNLLLPRFPELAEIHRQVKAPCILDGELMVQKNGTPSFAEVQRRTMMTDKLKIQLAARRSPATFVAFDLLELRGDDMMGQPLYRRKEQITATVRESERLAVSRVIKEHGTALYDLAVEKNLEGIVAKRWDSLYYPGKRTKDWIKIKFLKDDDFVVCGYIRKSGSVTSLVLGQYENGMLAYKGHVTLGVSNDVLHQLMASVQRPEPPMPVPSGHEKAVWLEPELVCSVRYMERTASGALRQPVFKGLRPDKQPEECRGD